MKIVINRCWGGFGLSLEGVKLYAKFSGFKIYPFVEKRDKDGNLDWKHFEPYKKGKDSFLIHYSKEPLNKNGTYQEKSYWSDRNIERNDPNLVKVVEQLRHRANANHSELSIVEIPDDVKWEIDDYDGMESIHEIHRSWG